MRAEEVVRGLPPALREEVRRYFVDNKLREEGCLRVDVVLALLRLNMPESLAEAERLSGVKITVCPSCLKPLPKIVSPFISPRPPTPRVSQVNWAAYGHVCGKVGARFKQVRVGLTEAQLVARGVTIRDLRIWTNRGAVTFA